MARAPLGPDLVGQVLAGKYRLLEVQGRGCFGTVFRAEQVVERDVDRREGRHTVVPGLGREACSSRDVSPASFPGGAISPARARGGSVSCSATHAPYVLQRVTSSLEWGSS